MRGGHCLKVGTKKQQMVSLSSAESELYAAVKTASEGLQSVVKDLEISCGLNLHLGASATICLVNRRELGKTKHVDMQNLWIQEASKSGRFVTKKVGTGVTPADLQTKPLPKPKIEHLMNFMGSEFMVVSHVPRGVYRHGHCARLLRFPDIPSGHIVVSSFVCALSDLRLICVTASMTQVKQQSEYHPSLSLFLSFSFSLCLQGVMAARRCDQSSRESLRADTSNTGKKNTGKQRAKTKKYFGALLRHTIPCSTGEEEK